MESIASLSILLLGAPKSGKSSVLEIISSGAAPHETVFFSSTTEFAPRRLSSCPLCSFPFYEVGMDRMAEFLRGEPQRIKSILQRVKSLIYVHDSGSPHTEHLDQAGEFFRAVNRHNPQVNLEFFIHKIDGESFATEQQQINYFHQIQKTINQKIASFQISFYLTSIYDKSLYEAMSKVLQKSIPQIAPIEDLLNTLLTTTNIEKGYILDYQTKLYLAVDSNPFDAVNYDLCMDVVTIVDDLTTIYGIDGDRRSTTIHFSGGSYGDHELIYHAINPHLVFLCILKSDQAERKGIIDHNIQSFIQGVNEIIQLPL